LNSTKGSPRYTRICSIKNCFCVLPPITKYKWKMCEECRNLHRMCYLAKKAGKVLQTGAESGQNGEGRVEYDSKVSIEGHGGGVTRNVSRAGLCWRCFLCAKQARSVIQQNRTHNFSTKMPSLLLLGHDSRASSDLSSSISMRHCEIRRRRPYPLQRLDLMESFLPSWTPMAN
jgi:hypothetical protein